MLVLSRYAFCYHFFPENFIFKKSIIGNFASKFNIHLFILAVKRVVCHFEQSRESGRLLMLLKLTHFLDSARNDTNTLHHTFKYFSIKLPIVKRKIRF